MTVAIVLLVPVLSLALLLGMERVERWTVSVSRPAPKTRPTQPDEGADTG